MTDQVQQRNSEFSSRAKEVENRYDLIRHFLPVGFVPYIPEYDAGVDFILYRERDDLLVKVQLKARWSVEKKYFGRNIWMAFPDKAANSDRAWYLVPHDLMVAHVRNKHQTSESWKKGIYNKPYLTPELRDLYREFGVPLILEQLSKQRIEQWTKLQAAAW